MEYKKIIKCIEVYIHGEIKENTDVNFTVIDNLDSVRFYSGHIQKSASGFYIQIDHYSNDIIFNYITNKPIHFVENLLFLPYRSLFGVWPETSLEQLKKVLLALETFHEL